MNLPGLTNLGKLAEAVAVAVSRAVNSHATE